jgi:hypothetical protein
LAKILDKILVTRTFRALTQILYLYYVLSPLAVSAVPAVNVANKQSVEYGNNGRPKKRPIPIQTIKLPSP